MRGAPTGTPNSAGRRRLIAAALGAVVCLTCRVASAQDAVAAPPSYFYNRYDAAFTSGYVPKRAELELVIAETEQARRATTSRSDYDSLTLLEAMAQAQLGRYSGSHSLYGAVLAHTPRDRGWYRSNEVAYIARLGWTASGALAAPRGSLWRVARFRIVAIVLRTGLLGSLAALLWLALCRVGEVRGGRLVDGRQDLLLGAAALFPAIMLTVAATAGPVVSMAWFGNAGAGEIIERPEFITEAAVEVLWCACAACAAWLLARAGGGGLGAPLLPPSRTPGGRVLERLCFALSAGAAALALMWLPHDSFPYSGPALLASLGGAFRTLGPAFVAIRLALSVVVAPVVEELLFRGVFYSLARRAYGDAFAIVFTSVTFAAYHGYTPQFYVLLVQGLALAGVRCWTGSLGPSVLAHVLNNLLSFRG